MSQIIFITGTDTGVGKTVATGLLLYNLRRRGIRALAVKPFCSGVRDDVRWLHRLQDGELSFEEINPWFFRLPLAPSVAARQLRREAPALQEVVQHIRWLAERCDVLLVEGAGGLLVPLGALRAIANGKGQIHCYTAADLIRALQAKALVVARNKLGTINHTLLTVQALPFFAANRLAVVLIEQKRPDLSANTNPEVLGELLGPVKVFSVPHLGSNPLAFSVLKKNRRILQKTLAKIFESAIFSALFGRKIGLESGIKKALTALPESVDSTR